MANENKCKCGFTAKTTAGLRAHERKCKNLDAQSEPKKDPVIDILEMLNENIKEISNRLSAVEKKQTPLTATEEMSKIIDTAKKDIPEIKDETLVEKKISSRHRQIVTEVLGAQFDAWETYDDVASTMFMFNVAVPLELSTMSAEDRRGGRRDDIRSKAVSLADGENGVREWCKKIKENLSKYWSVHGISTPFGQPE
jgi:hypothetical protein